MQRRFTACSDHADSSPDSGCWAAGIVYSALRRGYLKTARPPAVVPVLRAAALRLEIEGYEPGAIGIVLALTSLGFVLGSLFGIRIVQRVGHIMAFAVFAGIAAVAALSHPLHVSIPGWMLFRLALGFCIAGLMLVTESWINSHATPQSRGSLLATYMALFFLASSSGQFIVALGDPSMYELFVIAAIFIILSLVPISLTRSTPPQMEHGKRLAIRVLWARSELGLGGAAVSGVVLGAFGPSAPYTAMTWAWRSSKLPSSWASRSSRRWRFNGRWGICRTTCRVAW